MDTASKILAEYQIIIRAAQAQKTPHKEIQPLTPRDVMYLKAKMHPTAKKESKDMTRELLKFIFDNKIVTSAQIYDKYGWSDKPVMKRLKLLKEFGIIKQISKKYYLATPRLETLMARYVDELCK